MKNKGLIITLSVIGVIVLFGIILVAWGVGSYNNLVTLNENVNQSWSQVENQYQRRADLIPNLVNTVKGYANFERGVLTDVTEARAKVSQFNVTPQVLNDPQAFQKFQQLQGQLGGALSRLLVTVENYPKQMRIFFNCRHSLKARRTGYPLKEEDLMSQFKIIIPQ